MPKRIFKKVLSSVLMNVPNLKKFFILLIHLEFSQTKIKITNPPKNPKNNHKAKDELELSINKAGESYFLNWPKSDF